MNTFNRLLLFDLAYWLMPVLKIAFLIGLLALFFLTLRLLIVRNFPGKNRK